MTGVQAEMYPRELITALFMPVIKQEKPKCPSADEWINKTWHLSTLECYFAIQRKVSLSAAGEMNTEGIRPRERNQSQKSVYSIVRFHLHEMSKIGSSVGTKEINACQELGEGRMGREY